jgi:hypothetical protein
MLLADVGVVNSEWDAHPLVATEFAVCGLPVVTSECCGAWGEHDVLRVGENRFTYPCGQVEMLAEPIRSLLDDGA